MLAIIALVNITEILLVGYSSVDTLLVILVHVNLWRLKNWARVIVLMFFGLGPFIVWAGLFASTDASYQTDILIALSVSVLAIFEIYWLGFRKKTKELFLGTAGNVTVVNYPK